MKRADLLTTASAIVCDDRQGTYGDLRENFDLIASLWSEYVGREILPHDVAAMMALLKVARIKANPQHMDSWVDLAGYAACGGELA